MRASIAAAPTLKDVKFYGSPAEIAATGTNSATIKRDPTDVVVWPPAMRQFKFHHGGTDDEASVQLRSMLADFLAKSGRVISETNYLVLSRDGYRLHIAPSRDRITGYTTVHRERTWEQFKRGIPSRIGEIDAQPMPLLSSRNPVETDTAVPKERESIQLDASSAAPRKPSPHRPATSRPAAQAVPIQAARTNSIDRATKEISPEVAPEVVGPPSAHVATQAGLKAPPLESSVAAPIGVTHKPDGSNASAKRTEEPDQVTAKPAHDVKPNASIDQGSKSGPSTFTTAAVSIVLTLLVIRAARWFKKGSKAWRTHQEEHWPLLLTARRTH